MPKKANGPWQRYAVVLEYEGSSFSGFQHQQNAPSIQATLEAAIHKRFGEHARVIAASRTDAGVHARGQVAAFSLAYILPCPRLVAALNSALPGSIRVLRAKKVPEHWNPRRAAGEKTYTYLIFNRPVFSPLWLGRAWQITAPLDLVAMRQAAKSLIGRYDFSSFQAVGSDAQHPIRHIKQLTISYRDHLIALRFTANAFLYHMVRNLVGTLVEVGKGRLLASQMKKILKARNRRMAGPTAPAYGLYLDQIKFKKR